MLEDSKGPTTAQARTNRRWNPKKKNPPQVTENQSVEEERKKKSFRGVLGSSRRIQKKRRLRGNFLRVTGLKRVITGKPFNSEEGHQVQGGNGSKRSYHQGGENLARTEKIRHVEWGARARKRNSAFCYRPDKCCCSSWTRLLTEGTQERKELRWLLLQGLATNVLLSCHNGRNWSASRKNNVQGRAGRSLLLNTSSLISVNKKQLGIRFYVPGGAWEKMECLKRQQLVAKEDSLSVLGRGAHSCRGPATERRTRKSSLIGERKN